jgi:GT2 family glycosyltransferase
MAAVMSSGADDYVIVDLGGPEIVVPPADAPRVVAFPEAVGVGVPLPLAAARNFAVDQLDADVVVLLDVDVVPATGAVTAYRNALASCAEPDRTIAVGPVGYLPRGVPADRPVDELISRSTIQPGRPEPGRGTSSWDRWELFWSLSFAVTRCGFDRIGGFDEGYVGYGGEDTDFAFAARAAGSSMLVAHQAFGVHQYHEVSSPPVEHLRDIVVNARRFHAKWGSWPMEGWLRQFAESGLVEWDPGGRRLALRDDAPIAVGSDPNRP